MMFLSNKERVQRALGSLEPTLAAYVDRVLKNRYPKDAQMRARAYFDKQKREADRPIREWDTHLLLLLMKRSWREIPWVQVQEAQVRTLLDVRNRASHQREDLAHAETERALEMIDLLYRAVSPAPGPKLRKQFEEQIKQERGDPTWPEVLSRLWPTDWLGSYHFEADDGPNLDVVLRSSPCDAGKWEGVALCVLPMDRLYRKLGTSPAETLASEILASTRCRNSVVFLAVEEGCVARLRDAVCCLRAWEEVGRRTQDLMPHEEEGLRASLGGAERIVVKLLREAYCWLLIPTQSNSQSPVEWKDIYLESYLNPIEQVWKELEKNGKVVGHLAPEQLVEKLDRVPLWKVGPHVKVGELAHEFSRHLHLPRLKSLAVLDRALAEALMIPDWGLFAYASHHDEGSGYAGLYFRGSGQGPNANLLKHRVGFLVKPEAVAPALPKSR